MPTKRIEFDVKSFIQTLGMSSFSLAQLNEAYLKHETCQHTSPKTSRQYLYRNINSLIEIGFINGVKIPGTNVIEYRLLKRKIAATDANPVRNEQTTLSNAQVCDLLREKLKHSKLSLLTSIGETEAYRECVEEIPTLQCSVQTKYNLARDNTSKLLGKVKAYESLLKLYE